MGLYNVGILFAEISDLIRALFMAEISIFFLYAGPERTLW